MKNETFGMLLFLVAEVMFFAALASVYTVSRLGAAAWRPASLPALVTPLSVSNCGLLIASGGIVFLATRAIRREDPVGLRLYLLFTMLLGATFLGVQVYESYRLLQVVPIGTIFGSVCITLGGIHGLHVLGGLIFLGWVLARAFQGKYHRYRATGVILASFYWYFVVIVWIFLYLALYVY